MRCWLLVLALGHLGGCGGKADSSGGSPGDTMAQGGSAGAAPGGSAGTAQGGSAGVATHSTPLDDTFPWATASGDLQFPPGQNGEVLHIVAEGMPARSTLSTHNHFDPFGNSAGISFAARASAPTRLLVSASNAIQAYDYFAARSEGKQWPIAPVEVGTEWQEFSVPFADMMPQETDDADGIASFWLAFIVEHPEPVEVWLDEIRFVLKQEP